MKFKKQISKILVAGVLLNHLSILSYAGTLSPDTRYETFEGDSIKIDNIIEEDKVDVEIEGNTLVNIVKPNQTAILKRNPNSFYAQSDISLNYPLKANATYTICFNVTQNPYNHPPFSSIVLGQGEVGDSYSNRLRWNSTFNMDENKNNLGIQRAVFTTSSRIEETSFNYIKFIGEDWNDSYFDTIIEDIIIVEGEVSDLEYFEGIKSVSQDDVNGHQIEILSSNDTLLIDNEELKTKGELYFTKGWWAIKINKDVNRVKIVITNKDGLTRNCKLGIKNDIESEENLVYLFDMNTPFDTIERDYDLKGSNTLSFCTYGTNTMHDDFLDYYDIKVYSYDNIHDLASSVKHNKKEILLSEPLRSLPSGIKDRIIKKNGQWVVERNVGEIVLDGSRSWRFSPLVDEVSGKTKRFILPMAEFPNINADTFAVDKLANMISDKYITKSVEELVYNDTVGIGFTNTFLSIRDEDMSIEEFKEKLKANNITVLYPLKNKVYEPLDVDSILNLYKETTYISNDSIVPSNMKVVVDRILNRVIEFTEKARINPTVYNISLARMWVNLMDESILKDKYQNTLDNIAGIYDLTVDKKVVTSNLDLYIKPQNTLIMSLNTNSITFDDFSGVEDVEIVNAIDITVSSSLPYQLNAYLPVEIQSADKSNIMDKRILNIKENSESIYKTFINTSDKIILKDDCNSGNNLIHGIDIKLKGSIIHKKDVYKTTIKFEAEQK